jgi:hypothetical protein
VGPLLRSLYSGPFPQWSFAKGPKLWAFFLGGLHTQGTLLGGPLLGGPLLWSLWALFLGTSLRVLSLVAPCSDPYGPSSWGPLIRALSSVAPCSGPYGTSSQSLLSGSSLRWPPLPGSLWSLFSGPSLGVTDSGAFHSEILCSEILYSGPLYSGQVISLRALCSWAYYSETSQEGPLLRGLLPKDTMLRAPELRDPLYKGTDLFSIRTTS